MPGISTPRRRRHERRRPCPLKTSFDVFLATLLVGAAGQVVEAGRVEREPAAGLGRVEEGRAALRPRGVGDLLELGDPPVRRLHGAQRHEIDARPELVGDPFERNGHDPHPALALDQEREQHRGEVLVGTQHRSARRQRGGHHAGKGGDLAPGCNLPLGHTDQAGERRAAPGHPAVVARCRGCPAPPLVDRLAQILYGARRREPDGRGVEIAARPGEELARRGQAIRGCHRPVIISQSARAR